MKINDFMSKFDKLRDKNVLVGFSGGADSLALLIILSRFAKEKNFQLKAIHFEHGLRGEESLKDAKFCEEFCIKHEIPYQIISLEVMKHKKSHESMESSARRLRQEEFVKLNTSNTVVALGHHQNDAIENLFIHLLRGGNCSSLVNPQCWSEIKGVHYYRPLLEFSRDEIEEFLKLEGVTAFCLDHTNNDNTILRNAIRNEILPTFNKIVKNSYKGLAKSYEVLSYDADFINKHVELEYDKIRDLKKVDNSFYQNLDKAILVRVLRKYLSSKLGDEFIPNYKFMEKFTSIMNSNEFDRKKIELQNGNYYLKHRNNWSIEKAPLPQISEDLVWNFFKTPEIEYNNQKISATILDYTNELLLQIKKCPKNEAYFALDSLNDEIILSSRKSGDRIIDFNNRELKVKKLLIDNKLTDEEKSDLIYFRLKNDEIIYISSLKHSNFGKITNKNQKIIQFRVEKFKKWCIL